jgi:hypothetical protein
MIVEINKDIKDIINEMPYNKTFKMSALKIYGALYLCSRRSNKFGYFHVPSTYLMSINKRYKKIIDYFETTGLIEAYKRPIIEDDIFNTVYKKYYNRSKGICGSYRFLKNIEGENIDIDLATYKQMRWWSIIQESLLQWGWDITEIKIKRDTFGRRVHHPAIKNYKRDLKGMVSIDAVASQPTLLYLDMKERGINDPEYMRIFESGRDFYLELQYKLNIKERDDAKDLFMYWVNSSGYVPDTNIHKLFPQCSSYIKSRKANDYKNMASNLQRIESKIWIDDILENIPTEWAIPIHDCIVVRPEDGDRIYNWIQMRYPQLKIEKKIL